MVKNIDTMSFKALLHYSYRLKEGGKAWEKCMVRLETMLKERNGK
jgi:hypothetical protein